MVRELRKNVIPVFCCILFLGSGLADSQAIPKSETIWNPVLLMNFGIDASRVGYERLPTALGTICARALNGQRNNMIFARVRSGETEYIASMGYFDSTIEEYNSGEILEVRGNKCKTLDLEATLSIVPANGRYSATAAQEKQLVRPLIKDAIRRAAAAFGGDLPFRAQACKPEEEKVLSEAGFVIVRRELKAYCSEAAPK
jgi:hypothetical protein